MKGQEKKERQRKGAEKKKVSVVYLCCLQAFCENSANKQKRGNFFSSLKKSIPSDLRGAIRGNNKLESPSAREGKPTAIISHRLLFMFPRLLSPSLAFFFHPGAAEEGVEMGYGVEGEGMGFLMAQHFFCLRIS